MTSTLISSSPFVSKSKRKPVPSSWRTWIVPASYLRDFIYKHKQTWQFRYAPVHDGDGLSRVNYADEDCGWRTHLSLEVSQSTGQTFEATQRSLYRILSGESNCIHAEFAEAIVMSVDLFIDLDTNIPVLPGNLRCARELLEVRDNDFYKRSRDERLQLQREVMRLCQQIVLQPGKAGGVPGSGTVRLPPATEMINTPHHNPEAEEFVLGAMMISAKAIDAVIGILKPGDFYRQSYGMHTPPSSRPRASTSPSCCPRRRP